MSNDVRSLEAGREGHRDWIGTELGLRAAERRLVDAVTASTGEYDRRHVGPGRLLRVAAEAADVL